MPDGSTPITFREVDSDHFRGALALPVFGAPEMGQEFDMPELDGYPAGLHTAWRDRQTRQVCAIRVVTPDGARYWLSPEMPVRTYDEAMDQLGTGLKNGAQSALVEHIANEAAAAKKAGMTVKQYRQKLKDDATRRARRNAARQYQDRTEDYIRTLNATGKLKD